MRVLYVGDVVGRPGRRAIKELIPQLRSELTLDAVVVNAENAAGGSGLTEKIAKEFMAMPIDALLTGNHVWQKRDLLPFLDAEPHIIRPANYPEPCPGHGSCVLSTPRGTLGLIQLEGRLFMRNLRCPFQSAMDEIRRLPDVDAIMVDMHAEATSEKQALGFYLDGKVSAVFGTHTHVTTADERILPKGTAYMTDVGMTGPINSVIGMRIENSFTRIISQRPSPHQVASGPVELNAVLFETLGNKAQRVERIRRYLED